MSEIAIRTDGLGKRYRIGRRREPYRNLRDALVEGLVSSFRRSRDLLLGGAAGFGNPNETVWALRDVCLEVKEGEIVGIIGRNGAGKSTLLKILSRITEPTTGSAEVRGRVGSLLEVGTGFHPELTGRENVYLNGAILGMRRAEINRKFDEIVAFAEVERFIDTSVKYYSTGMYFRLAFAVAAHLEPEILLVDEVLAVGDARFQKRCLEKMQDVGRLGRTVLFVSHNMPAITRLCERVVLLEEGSVLQDGPAHQVVGKYLSSGLDLMAVREWPDLSRAPGDDVVRLRSVRIRTEDGRIVDAVDIRKPVRFEMEFDVLEPGHVLVPNFNIFNEESTWLFSTVDQDPTWRRRPRPTGHYVSTAWIPGNLLAEGMFFVGPAMMTPEPYIARFREPDAVAFHVIDSLDGDSARADWHGDFPGVVRPLLQWTTEFHPGLLGVGSTE